jgi:hypothetical protein
MKEIQLTKGKVALVDDADEAAICYDSLAKKLHGEFANLNFK